MIIPKIVKIVYLYTTYQPLYDKIKEVIEQKKIFEKKSLSILLIVIMEFRMLLIYNRIYPRTRREVPAGGLWPPGEGANLYRHLVPYHGKCKRIQSRIKFIYLFIYMHQPRPRARHRNFGPGK